MILKGEQKKEQLFFWAASRPSLQQLKGWHFQNLHIPFLNGVLE
jgi:hypothetical protein